MGNGHSLACNKGHIYEKINENVSKTQMGKRNESLVTLDVKINDLENNTEKTGHDDTTYAAMRASREDMEDWNHSSDTDWFQQNGWQQQQFRRREDILYNIFMNESQENQHLDFSLSGFKPENNYGRLASLDVSMLDVKSENNYF